MEERKPEEIIVEQILEDGLARLRRGECPTEVLGYIIGRTIDESEGKFTKESFANYDEAMRILNIGNRNTLKSILNKHRIKMQKINNQKVGFLRSEIESLLHRR